MKKIISFDSSSLISSILFLLIGIILFTNPNGIVSFISYILGIVTIIIGIIKIISAQKDVKTSNHDSVLTFGIICIVIGIILIFCGSIIELVLRFFMGAWILISGINKMVLALNLKATSKIWNKLLIISIILIIIGIYVIVRSNLVFSTIGLIMIIFSIFSIIGYFIVPKQKNSDII